MKKRLPLIPLLCITLVACDSLNDTNHPPQPKRIILIAIDSLRADHLSYMGYTRQTSPWLDQLATQSANFTTAISPSNVTRRSVASYFTGKPYTNIHHDPTRPGIPEDETTLAEILQQAGFKTHAWTANNRITHQLGYAQGIDNYNNIRLPSKIDKSIEDITASITQTYTPSTDREFIYIHTMDVHHPYRPPLPHATKWAEPYHRQFVREGTLYLNDQLTPALSTLPYWSQQHDIQQPDIDFITQLYDAAIRYTDAELQNLLNALQFNPAQDILIITADHGEQFFERDFWGHNNHLLPEEVHVPLLIHYNGFKNQTHTTPVSLLDILPTLCDLFNLQTPQGTIGQSLLPTLTGAPLQPRTAYTEGNTLRSSGAAIITEDYLYWIWADRSTRKPWHPSPHEEHLYARKTDPQSLTNLATTDHDTANELNNTLRAINPYWTNYTHTALNSTDADVTFGPNLLATQPLEQTRTGITLKPILGNNETLTLHQDTQAIRYPATNLTPGIPHYLQLDFKLTTGQLHLTIINPTDNTTQHQHTHTTPSDAWQNIGIRFTPTTPDIRLHITLTPPAQAQLNTPTLRQILTPNLQTIPQKTPQEDTGFQQSDLTEQEKMELRTLGYVD